MDFPTSIAFLDDLLIIACRSKGVGRLDLSEMKGIKGFSEKCQKGLVYGKPAKLPEGGVLNLIPFQSQGLVGVVVGS